MGGAEILRARETLTAPLAALLALLFYLPGLGAGDFVGDDESLDAGVVQEIVRGGSWWFPEFNGEILPPKPPLFYWSAAAASRLHGGFGEWSVRIPSALFAAASVALTVASGARIVGSGPAALAGALLATTPLFYDQARIGRADMLMALLVGGCLFFFHLRPDPLPVRDRWLFFALLGLTALAKGGAGVGIVGVVVAAEGWLGRRSLRPLAHRSFLAFALLGGSWYALGIWHWGDRFWTEHVIGENVRHFFGTPGRGVAHTLAHVPNFFGRTFPWGLFLPVALLHAWRDADLSPGRRFLVRWLAAGFLLLTVASRKSPYYLLPLLPPVALLVASWAWARLASPPAGRPLRPWRAGMTLALGAMVAFLPFRSAVKAARSHRDSLRTFADDVRRIARSDAEAYFFVRTLPAVVVYSGLRIPTLEPDEEPPSRSFLLIVPENRRTELPARWRERARTVAHRDVRPANVRRMEVRLLRINFEPAAQPPP